jgi:hypothetical protein
MRPYFLPLALSCLAVCLLPGSTLLAQPAPVAAAATSTLADPAAYLARQFGPTFTLDPKVAPIFGDLDGDGNEDLVLVGTSPTPMRSEDDFNFRVEDPYDAYFGTNDVTITSQFTLHFDGSARCLLIVFGWRLPPPARPGKIPSKFVLINTPFETASITNFRLKKKKLQAIEAVDNTDLHALIFWDTKHWKWDAR